MRALGKTLGYIVGLLGAYISIYLATIVVYGGIYSGYKTVLYFFGG